MNYLEITAALIVIRLDSLLSALGVEESLKKFPVLSALVSGISEEDLKFWSKMEEEPDDSPYFEILSLLGGDIILRNLLDLSIAVFCFPETDAYITHHFGHGVNLQLAYYIENLPFPDETGISEKREVIRKYFKLDDHNAPLRLAPVRIDERLMYFLMGKDEISPELAGFVDLYRTKSEKPGKVMVNTGLMDSGISFFKSGGKVLQLSGKGGRRFIARRISDAVKKDFLFLNIKDLIHEGGKDRFDELRDCLLREAILSNAGICFFGIDRYFLFRGRSGPDAEEGKIRDLEVLERKLFIPLVKENIPLILCSDLSGTVLRSLSSKDYRNLRLPKTLKFDERRMLWEGILKDLDTDFDPYELSLRYRLNASEISGIIKSFLEVRGEKSEDRDENELLTRICVEELMGDKDSGLGRIVYPDITLDDVRVKEPVMNVLKDVVTSVRSGAVILDRWNLVKTYPYGRSISLLISGPPGTGKTMTANAIAGELKLALYQVNISNIVDKYIGETEKNLEKVFDYAEKSNAILFFDEADAIFGTRSEVHDSRDRYANTEISYLLQRIEAYDGIVIMATNIKGNIDPAFMRRIRYVVHFENPDEEMRKKIWQDLLTKDVPHEDIDIDYLAAQFDE
ncbi:MAG: ATP-binding protein, partial [Lachnospiraceae bacterium]|nr:ATP-binding protein [Lachnospiraceae bacterium]